MSVSGTFHERWIRASRLVAPVAACGILLAIPAWLVAAPFLAPPMGASIYVCVRGRGTPAAAPRRVIVSHIVAILCGNLARVSLGVKTLGLSEPNLGAATFMAGVLAIVLTAFFIELLDAMHPPACATTLVISLGIAVGAGPQIALAVAAAVLAGAVALYDREVARRATVERSAT